ncbi:MAG: hypothetical protein AAF806_28005, partial [Bacteroidota bacterium]
PYGQATAKVFKRADIKFCFTELYVCPFKPPPDRAAKLRRSVNMNLAKFVKEPHFFSLSAIVYLS